LCVPSRWIRSNASDSIALCKAHTLSKPRTTRVILRPIQSRCRSPAFLTSFATRHVWLYYDIGLNTRIQIYGVSKVLLVTSQYESEHDHIYCSGLQPLAKVCRYSTSIYSTSYNPFARVFASQSSCSRINTDARHEHTSDNRIASKDPEGLHVGTVSKSTMNILLGVLLAVMGHYEYLAVLR